MRTWLDGLSRFLEKPLGFGPRALLVLAFLLLVPSYLVPLYDMTMFAPQYQDGLRMHIYSYKLEGGNDGQDVKEMNLLNHYIGMKDLCHGRVHGVQVDAVRRRGDGPALPAQRRCSGR